MSRAVTWIGLAAAAVFALGVIVAITQPGDLGGDDEVALSTSTTQATVAESTTTVPTTGVPPTTEPVDEPATTAPPTGGTGGTSTGSGTSTGTGSGGGSGLGANGAGSAQPGELVNSGHESLILPGLLLAGVGALVGRRRRRP